MDTPITDPTHPDHWHHVALVLGRYGHRRPAIPLSVPAAGGSVALYSGQCLLLGWSISDQSGAANGVIFRGGTDATSQVLGGVTLAASGASTQWFGPNGIHAMGGLFVAQSGSLSGSVFVLPIH
jgi:hypothetical protein